MVLFEGILEDFKSFTAVISRGVDRAGDPDPGCNDFVYKIRPKLSHNGGYFFINSFEMK